jgi:hypothetical protein
MLHGDSFGGRCTVDLGYQAKGSQEGLRCAAMKVVA